MQKLWFVVFTAIGFVSVADCVGNSNSGDSSTPLIKVNKTIIETQPLAASLETSIQSVYQQMRSKDLRKFPYPFNAMLAISSDIDDTTPSEFVEYHRFLNTHEQTPQGPGLGLDVGDSFWVYMGNNQPNITDKDGHGLDGVMTFFTGLNPNQPHDAGMIQHYWAAGWIDSIHTFGDFSRKNTTDAVFNRQLAVDAWHALDQAGIHPTVWINHGNEANVQDFGGYGVSTFFRYQQGEVPTSPYYHSDLTVRNGVHFVWNSVAETNFGNNSPIFEDYLQDGQKVWGFHRITSEISNNTNNWIWVPRDLHLQITQQRLDQLVQQQQYSIVAQHLGGYNIGFPFLPLDVEALQLLVNYQNQGKIIVARTSRLLNYAVAQQFVNYSIDKEGGQTWVTIRSIDDPIFGSKVPSIDDLRGITFYTDDPAHTSIRLKGSPLNESDIQRNPADLTGRKSIGIKWFTPDYTDYSK